MAPRPAPSTPKSQKPKNQAHTCGHGLLQEGGQRGALGLPARHAARRGGRRQRGRRARQRSLRGPERRRWGDLGRAQRARLARRTPGRPVLAALDANLTG